MMPPKRVLFLVDCLGRGGAAQVVINAALALDRSRYLPTVCVTRDAPINGNDKVLEKAGVPLILLNRKSAMDLPAWRTLWPVLSSIDIIHSHESGSNFWARIWGRLFRIPIIITQDHTASDEKSTVVRLFDQILSPLSDRIISVSEYDRELLIRLENIPPNKVHNIYNGIDTSKFTYNLSQQEAREKTNLPRDKFLLVVIARLVDQKNHSSLFKAVGFLPADIRNHIHCAIVGTGNREHDLKNEVDSLNLQETISFLGERLDIPFILRAADLFVLPSHWECLPMVVLEALASKCAVVSTAVGGIPEIMQTVGWPLVPPNDPVALSKAIIQMYQMPESKREKIREAGRKTVESKFSKESSVKEIESLYDSFFHKEKNEDITSMNNIKEDKKVLLS